MKTFVLKLGLLCAAVNSVGLTTAAQQPNPALPVQTAKPQPVGKIEPGAVNYLSNSNARTEKAIETVARPSISLCASVGQITVRGWQRSEVRALADNRTINFKIMERGADNKPAWIMAQNGETTGKNATADECFSGESLELEIPLGAKVDIKSRDANVLVDSIAKITVKNANGNVTLRNITEEIAVSNYSGDVAAEDSSGRISLSSFDGSVAAFRLRPNESSDALNLNSTGGAVVLRDVLHKNIEAKSLSGEIAVMNSLAPGGSYEFTTQSGSISLQLAKDFPFRIKAEVLAGGNCQTDFPIKPATENLSGRAKIITYVNGAGDTSISLTTFNGLLRIKKQP